MKQEERNTPGNRKKNQWKSSKSESLRKKMQKSVFKIMPNNKIQN